MRRMKLIGSAIDESGPQLFLLSAPARAEWWLGTTNGTTKGDEEGSHWDLAFNILNPEDAEDDGAKARAIDIDGHTTDVLMFGVSGWILAYEVDERIVLVDGAFDEELESRVKSEAGGTERVPRHAGFEKYVTSPPARKALAKHVLDTPDGWLLLMTGTSSVEKLKRDRKRGTKRFEFSELQKTKERVLQLEDGSGGHALLLRMKAQRIQVAIEAEVDQAWGSAQRAVLSPA
jgi:hypothetical protein